MSTAPARSFTRLAVAIVIAAVVILAATLSYSGAQAMVTKTSTFTTTLSTAVTVLMVFVFYEVGERLDFFRSYRRLAVLAFTGALIGNLPGFYVYQNFFFGGVGWTDGFGYVSSYVLAFPALGQKHKSSYSHRSSSGSIRVTIQSPRRYLVLAAAVVIAALVIASSILASSYLATGKTVTDDMTTTSIQTTTQLSTITSIRTQTVVAQSNYTITSTITTRSTATITNVTTSTVTQNKTSTATETVNNPIPWYGLEYLSTQSGCTVSSGITSYPAPCDSFSDPYVFDCAAAAATPQGCTAQVNITGTTNESYTITIWYPYNSGDPGQNCYWTQILPGQPIFEQINAYCIPVNSTAFIVSEPILSGYV